jgi:Leucine Rich repeat
MQRGGTDAVCAHSIHRLYTMSDETNTTVEAFSLQGLSLLRNAGILVEATATTTDDDEVVPQLFFCASWPDDRVQFNDATGEVTFLNLGGKRLHRGFPCSCSANVFHHFSALQSLNLGGTDLPLKDTAEVLRMVANSIVSIHLGGNGLGNEGATMIGRWLVSEKPANLKKIDLRYNDIGSDGMEAFCEGLLHSAVMYLHMEGNGIGNAGCAALGKLLKQQQPAACCCKLIEVFLGANQIEAVGAVHLASSLTENTTLSKLYLEGNSIGLEGATAFSEALEALKENKHLNHLYVDNNNIGKEGSQRLARALQSSTAIPDGV